MTGRSDTERFLDAFLAPEAEQLSDRVLKAALSDIARTPQRRALRVPWRFTNMPVFARAAAAALALVVVVGASGVIYLNYGGALVGGPNATVTPSPAVQPTPSPSPMPPLDTTGWIPYTSARYGVQMAYPPDWRVVPADHDWTWEADATNWLSTAHDAFIAPGDALRVSVWTVPLPQELDQSWAVHEAWAIDYCTKSGNAPCTGIHERIVPMCIEPRDCHEAVIVPFNEDVQFFGHGGVLPEGMTIVAVWRPESDSSVAPFGGSQRLLEQFLSTMNIVLPFYPESQAAAAAFLATGGCSLSAVPYSCGGSPLPAPSVP